MYQPFELNIAEEGTVAAMRPTYRFDPPDVFRRPLTLTAQLTGVLRTGLINGRTHDNHRAAVIVAG